MHQTVMPKKRSALLRGKQASAHLLVRQERGPWGQEAEGCGASVLPERWLTAVGQ